MLQAAEPGISRSRKGPMYSFKYHLVTICAVFLSLAIGLLLGAAIGGSGTLSTTTSDLVDSLFARYSNLSSENSAYELESSQYQSLSGEFVESWDDDRLEDRSILIVTGTTSSESNISDEISGYVSDAGADYVIVRVNEESFGTANASILEGLQQVLPSDGDEDYGDVLAAALVDEWTSREREDQAEDDESDDGDGGRGSDSSDDADGADGDDDVDDGIGSSSGGSGSDDDDADDDDASPGDSGSKDGNASSGSEEASIYDGGSVTADGGLTEEDAAAYPVTAYLIENEVIEIENASAIPDDIDGYVDIYVSQVSGESEGSVDGSEDESDDSGDDSSDGGDGSGSEDESEYEADTVAADIGSAFSDVGVNVVFTQSASVSDDLMDQASTRGVAGVSSYSGYLGRYSIVSLLESGESGVYGPDRDTAFWYPAFDE